MGHIMNATNELTYHIDYLSKHELTDDEFPIDDALNYLKSADRHQFDALDKATQDLLFQTFDRLIQNNETVVSLLNNDDDSNTDLMSLLNEPKHSSSLIEYLDVLSNISTRIPCLRRNIRDTLSFKILFKLLNKLSNEKINYKKKIPKETERLLGLILSIIESVSEYFNENSFKVNNATRVVLRIANEFDAYLMQSVAIVRNIHQYEEEEASDGGSTEQFDVNSNDDVDESVKKFKLAIEHTLAYESVVDLIQSPSFLKALRYIICNLKYEKFETIKEGVAFVCLLVDFMRHNYRALCVELQDLDDDKHAQVVKRLSYIHYITTSIISVYASQSFKFNMVYVGKAGAVEFIFDLLQNEDIHAIVLKCDSNHVIKSLYGKIITVYTRILHQIKYFYNQFKEIWQPYGTSVLFNLSKRLTKFDIDSQWFMNIIPFILNYDDDDQETPDRLFDDVYTRHTSKHCCECLIEMNDPIKIYKSRKALNYLSKFLYETNEFHEFDSEFIKKCIKLFVELVKHGHLILAKTLKEFDAEINEYQSATDSILQVDLILRNTIYLMQTFADKSIQFCISFHEEDGVNGVKTFLDLLNDPILLQNILNYKNNMIIKLLSSSFYEYLLTAVYNLSKAAYKYKENWTSLNAFAKLLELGKKLRLVNSHFKLMTFLIIGNIASDEDLNNFSASLSILETIMSIVKSFAEGLTSAESDIKRKFFQIDENDTTKVEIIVVRGWNLFEILESLYKFSINDNIKGVIYETLKMKEYLRMIISNGNEVEQEIAFKLLKQLCFDKRIASDIQNDTDLVGYMNYKISNKSEISRENLVRTIESILWLINEDDHKVIASVKNENLKHIFISYNSETRSLCIAIKKTLQSLNYEVWIDTENIHGSSIDSMAKGIEASYCILICVTEKYKASANCRLEAEYAVQQKKPIIPLMMQSNFKPDGWLGLIMGTKIYIDFTKHDYDECLSRLKKELSTLTCNMEEKTVAVKTRKTSKNTFPNIPIVNRTFSNEELQTKRTNSVESKSTTPTTESTDLKEETQQTETIKSVTEWSEVEVANWFDTKAINKAIKEALTPCDGLLLEQYFKMSKEAPEFFYSTLRTDSKTGLKDIARFTMELKALFPKLIF